MCGSSIQGVDESDGLKIDGWFMGRKIGKGASGKVFLAKNAKTGKVFRRPKYFFLDPYENKHTGKLAAIKVCPLNNLYLNFIHKKMKTSHTLRLRYFFCNFEILKNEKTSIQKCRYSIDNIKIQEIES